MQKIATQAELDTALAVDKSAELELISGDFVVSVIGNASPVLHVHGGVSLIIDAYDSSMPRSAAHGSSKPIVVIAW